MSQHNDLAGGSVTWIQWPYLLVACGAEGILDRVRWVTALLAAEVPLAGGVARATGHPGSGWGWAGWAALLRSGVQLDHGWRLKPPVGDRHTRTGEKNLNQQFCGQLSSVRSPVEPGSTEFIDTSRGLCTMLALEDQWLSINQLPMD